MSKSLCLGVIRTADSFGDPILGDASKACTRLRSCRPFQVLASDYQWGDFVSSSGEMRLAQPGRAAASVRHTTVIHSLRSWT
jgi:hypothetical protein